MATFNFEQTKNLLHDSNFYYIICTDTTGNYSYINNRYAKSFKYIHENFLGQPFHITMHPDDLKVCEEVGGKCYAEPGKLFPATIRKHNGQGGYVVTQWEFTLMVEDDTPQGIFCLGYDITEYESAKNEVKIINKDLENKQVLLETIAYEQSHIVRAPLANIMGLVSILKKLTLNTSEAAICSMLEESSNRLDEAIKNIITKADTPE
ncbi:MAG: PAS domain S-box protein [Sphingobacteriaceae bacterium]|nr:MAG: PAS domain S-box protein [Sphingobacteriaceae bacterium]